MSHAQQCFKMDYKAKALLYSTLQKKMSFATQIKELDAPCVAWAHKKEYV